MARAPELRTIFKGVRVMKLGQAAMAMFELLA